MRIKSMITGSVLATAISVLAAPASAISIDITITNIAPAGGVYLTPVWVGFHNGSFDSYDGGTASAPELEALAEDGDTAPISGVFGANGTLVATATAQTGTRVQDTLGGLLAPGGTVTQRFQVDLNSANRYLSYASMVLPSSDYYIANGNPLAHDLLTLLAGGSTSFFIGAPNGGVNDAGTEVNDFATSAGNPLFGIPGGQSGPNQGANENGVNANVVGDPYGGFANQPVGGVASSLDFNSYDNGIARVDIAVAPVPGSVVLMVSAFAGAGFIARRRMAKQA